MGIPMKLVCQYMTIFFNFSLTLNHFHSLQAENCDSNSRLVVDEDDNGKLRLEMVKLYIKVQLVQAWCMKNRRYNSYTRRKQ